MTRRQYLAWCWWWEEQHAGGASTPAKPEPVKGPKSKDEKLMRKHDRLAAMGLDKHGKKIPGTVMAKNR